MVKSKSKKGVPKPRPRKEAGPNLFERLSNKKRFDVLGRKQKGETRHVGQLRTAAVEKRKSTLLVEYKQLRKSNAFIDRRFGEDDDSLTADERAILRFQKQRMREMAGSKFTLADGDAQEDELTHLGQSLAELQGGGGGETWGFGDDDDDARLDAELTRELHFGGGLFERKRATEGGTDGDGGDGGDDGAPRHRSKKEVMAEVMAKSKAFRAEKQAQRGEDEEATEALDEAWRQLAGGGGLGGMLRPKGAKPEAAPAAEEDRRFDVLTKELLFEAKAQPGERTLAPAELEEMERQRLKVLEAARLARQRAPGGDDLDDDFLLGGNAAVAGDGGGAAVAGDGQPAGGYALRRAKRAKREAERAARAGKGGSGTDSEDSGSSEDDASDDEEGSSSEEEEEEEEGAPSGLEARRQAAAAGGHPLQDAFRQASARLLQKFGVEQPGNAGSDSAEDESAEEDEEDEDDDDSEEEAGSSSGDGSSDAASSSDEEESQDEGAEEQQAEEAAALPPPSAALSFTPPLPESYPQFAAMAAGLSAEDLGELLRRIRAFNAAALNSEGRTRLQALYGSVAQHFSTLAGAAPPSLPHLDALLPHLLELTPQVPFYAATLARARLAKAQQRMAQRLRDPLLRADAWPAPRTLCLLRLLATLYPPSDKRHPVLTPAGLLACGALAQCPLARPRDAATGLFLASFALRLHSEAKRFVPEPLTFALGLLRSVLPAAPAEDADEDPEPRWLCTAGVAADELPGSVEAVAPLPLLRLLGSGYAAADAAYFSSPAFKASAATAAAALVARCAEVLADIDALPEIMSPAIEALRAIVAAAAPAANGTVHANGSAKPRSKKKTSHPSSITVAPGVAAACAQALASVEAACVAAAARRGPLCIASMVALPAARQFNPRFEEGYAAGKDYDPDRTRAEQRRLQRELRREERGAMRELRKDGAFMAGVRDRDRTAAGDERDKSAKRAMSFLQQQESDFKSGGQGGMWKKRKHK